jgi:hypothetical protein
MKKVKDAKIFWSEFILAEDFYFYFLDLPELFFLEKSDGSKLNPEKKKVRSQE